MELKRITKEDFFANLKDQAGPWKKDYLVMYSTQWKGMLENPEKLFDTGLQSL